MVDALIGGGGGIVPAMLLRALKFVSMIFHKLVALSKANLSLQAWREGDSSSSRNSAFIFLWLHRFLSILHIIRAYSNEKKNKIINKINIYS